MKMNELKQICFPKKQKIIEKMMDVDKKKREDIPEFK